MTVESSPKPAHNGLHRRHQPRPWICTRRDAIWCPIHGDCTCAKAITLVAFHCPLHGAGTTHPDASEQVA